MYVLKNIYRNRRLVHLATTKSQCSKMFNYTFYQTLSDMAVHSLFDRWEQN